MGEKVKNKIRRIGGEQPVSTYLAVDLLDHTSHHGRREKTRQHAQSFIKYERKDFFAADTDKPVPATLSSR